MADVKLHISTEIHNEMQARINAWKREKEQLLKAQDRIAELDALIKEAESASAPHTEAVEKARKEAEDRAAEEAEASAKAAEKAKAEAAGKGKK